ncbi:MAG TPA: MlaD family protein, partial [Burkholderiales bacterium]|nr:MlaD family protein [Burkholderiales bacterium]
MESRAYALAAGIFTLVLGIAVVLAAMWLSGETYEKVYYVLESKSPVTGLSEQAYVRFRGVDVGKVTDLRFDPKNARVILIEIGVQPGTPITRGTYAEIRPQGVTGLSYVMLDDTGANPERLPPATEKNSARIMVKPTLLENLFAASGEALADVRQVAQRVNAFLSDENKEQLTRTLASMQTATARVASLAQAAEPGAKSIAPFAADARKTLQHANSVLDELSKATRELAGRMEAIDRVAGSAEKAGTAAEQAGASVAKLADAVALESLPRINLLVEELTRTTRGVDRLVGDVKQQPQSLVFGRKAGPPGPGEQGF